jgi:hypothetical protein
MMKSTAEPEMKEWMTRHDMTLLQAFRPFQVRKDRWIPLQ